MDSQREAERRRHPRINITWPVVIHDGGQVFHTQAVNISVRGAKVAATEPPALKVAATEPLALGSLVWLHFHPPDEPPLDLSAVAWRLDPDGLAFFFIEDLDLNLKRFTTSEREALHAEQRTEGVAPAQSRIAVVPGKAKVYAILSRHPAGLTPHQLALACLSQGLAVGEPTVVAERLAQTLKELEVGPTHRKVVKNDDGSYRAVPLW